jgi:succinate dehydrogenase / fumarate reductase cytochrome b subunit
VSSTVAVSPSHAAATRHFLLRRLHSLTGIMFGGYLVFHLIINATLIQGGDVFANQVAKIHGLPFLPALEWGLIYLPILFHTVYGVWIILSGQPNVANYPYAKNIFYTLQRISAIIIVAFMFLHVLGMKGLLGEWLAFDAHAARATTAKHINASWWIAYIVYPLGVLASCFHLANGFWAAAITWGLTVSKGAQRRWGVVCTGIFFFTLACGLMAWGAVVGN